MPKATKVWLALRADLQAAAQQIVSDWGQLQPLCIPGAEQNNYDSLCDFLATAIRTYLESGIDLAIEPGDTAPGTAISVPPITALCWQGAIKSGKAHSYSDLANRAILRVVQWHEYRSALNQRLRWELSQLDDREWSHLLKSRTLQATIRRRSEIS